MLSATGAETPELKARAESVVKTLLCRDTGVECDWRGNGDSEDEVLKAFSEHSVEVHRTWPEDGPIPTWVRLRKLVKNEER